MEKNPDLAALQASLGEIVDSLAQKQEDATDPAVIKALAIEIREVLFRVTTVQQLLFRQQTDRISRAVEQVADARADLDKAIADIEKLNRFLRTISGFLGLVDKVLDVAKLI